VIGIYIGTLDVGITSCYWKD